METNNNSNAGAGSLDLFSSQESSQETNNINEQIDITLQLTEFIWVQCDHPYCQKWRRIPAANADKLEDKPWYCSMNPDLTLNSCDTKEEDYRRYDRMAKKVGIKFVKSALSIGTLVWGKTAGYCRWPGLVTPDPMTGVHIHLDIDGDPHSYHIEYLGNPHTHSWVSASFVEVYGHKDVPKPAIERCPNKGRKKKGTKKAKSGVVSQNKIRNTYRQVRVEDVMREADFLLDMTYDERMKFCIFKYDPRKAELLEFDYKKSLKVHKKCNNCGENPLKKKQKLKQEVRESTEGICNLIGVTDNFAVARKTEEKQNYSNTRKEDDGSTFKKGENNLMTKEQNLKLDLQSSARDVSMVELTAGLKTNSGATTNVVDSPNQFSQSKLKISSSLVNRTKEEKFRIDIDLYMRNEKAFEHDVRRFMKRNDRSIRASPTWHKVPISLFQLFLAVHERGGFQRVCESKSWTKVYKELTDMQHVTTGNVAKNYYERNLYPYELFISGQDYTDALDKFMVKPKPRIVAAEVKTPMDTNNTVENGTSDYASYCSDIEAILGQLEDDYKATMAEENSKIEMKKKLGVGLTFHDETPSSPSQKFATVPSEFEQKASDLASNNSAAQQVPDADNGDDIELNLDDVEDKILTEMKALEDQMREMHDEIDELI